ncbi:hypothetical protein KJ865_00550, partial [Myxococcota bacterium]|nr:hypothetical protein [Myxococcota bacterium]
MKQLHLIDASAYIFRAFHGLRPLTAPDGTPTNAVYGYTQMLFRILRDAGDSLVAAVFDAPGKSFRADLYDAYKANRPPAPEEIKIQIPLCQKLTEYLGIPAFSMSGFEADDIIATLATMGRRAGMEIIIHSADKDLMQLVDDHTHLFDSMRDKTYDSAAVEEKFGVGPALIGDLLALMGDSSDNIPGVAGVGAKTAAKLLVEHGSLENVLAAASSIKGKLGEKLARDTDKARLSRVLVELRTDIPMEHPLEQLARLQTPHMEELRDMLLSLGFKRVLDQVEQTLRAGSTPEARAQEPGTANTTVTSATVPDQLVMPEAAGGVAIQIWVDGEDPLKAEPTGYALGNGTHTLYVPLGYTLFRQGIDQEKGLAALKPILEDPSIPKTIYQHKHLLQVCQRYNITVAGPVIDPLIISYLVDASRTDLSLEALTESELGIPLAGSRALMGTGAKAISFHELPPEKAQEAAKHEIEALWALGSHLESLMDEETRSIYLTMELPLTRVLARLEATGILLNREVLAELEGTLGKAMLEYEQKIREEAGYDININSPKQLQKFLFEEQGIPPMKKIKTGHSTDAETLELLAEHYEVASWIHEYRTLSKLLSTYILALPKMIHAKTGRVHTHFNQA